MLTRAIDHYREETKETLVSACRLLGVNRQVYYRRKKAGREKLETAKKVVSLVGDIRMQMSRIGTRKLNYLLKDQLRELGVGRDKLFTILRANQMLIKPDRSYQKTTDSHHRFYKHKNLVAQLTPSRPEQVWASDITYLGSHRNYQYLALVTDVYSKKIVGYDVSSSLSAEGAIRALNMGLKQRTYPDMELIYHSDRGFQYCCDEYQEILNKINIRCSMTESYDPYANAVAERVNGILKQEFILDRFDVKLPVMKEMVNNSIQIYNQLRPHLSCYMKTPDQMHKQAQIKIKTYRKNGRIKANLYAAR